jgi:hypothetical protein
MPEDQVPENQAGESPWTHTLWTIVWTCLCLFSLWLAACQSGSQGEPETTSVVPAVQPAAGAINLAEIILQSGDLPVEFKQTQKRTSVSDFKDVMLLVSLTEAGPQAAYGVVFDSTAHGQSLGHDLFVYPDEASAIQAFKGCGLCQNEPPASLPKIGDQATAGAMTFGGEGGDSYWEYLVWRNKNVISFMSLMSLEQAPLDPLIALANQVESRLPAGE